MKNLIYYILILFFLTNIYSQNQDTIKNYPGIPLITYMGLQWNYVPFIPEDQFKQIDSAGIFALQISNLTKANFDSKVKNTGLLVMPEQVDESVIDSAYIYRYTEGRYTIFEAEGTPLSEGKVTLYNDSLARDIINGSVVTKLTTQNGTLIYGPMYPQCVHYAAIQPGIQIDYRARYSLKLEDISSVHPLPTDTICILRVSTTRTWDDTLYWGFWETKTINERAITYQEFIQKGHWLPFDLDYDLLNIPSQYLKIEQPPFNNHKKPVKNIEGIETDRVSVNCIEFKLIWKGNSTQVKLSVDKIVLSDNRGRELYDPLSRAELNIKSQIDQSLIDFEGRVAGWIGLDEPWSLDMWGAIRKVSEIIDSYPNSAQAKLYFQFNASWNGRFGDYGDVARASKVIMIDEFMRRVKKGNIWVTNWLYDLPCDGIITDAPCNGTEDFRSLNITWAADSIYKKFTDAAEIFPDLHYGISIQTGKYRYKYNGDVESRIREITGYELLYQTNLSLMYGAKLISPWLYFGHCNGIDDDFTGFRNPQHDYAITDKYLTLKNTIAPRLSGLMGKTLKNLIPLSQHLNYQLNTSQGFIQSITAGSCITEGMQSGDEAYDLGFFKDAQDADYFMLINRWYNGSCNPQLTININPLSFPDNYNLNVVNLINNTTLSTITRYGNISAAPEVGDACFFSVTPVVKFGGTLDYNDTIKTNTILIDNMIINNSQILNINDGFEYTIQDTVILLGTGFIAGDGYVNLTSAGEIIINSWNYGLFKAKSNNHPKLFWGKYPGTLTVSYYSIYRKIGAGNWQFLANTTNRNYTDQSLGIVPPNGQSGTTVYYKLIAVFINETQSSYSNIVQFDCSIKQIEKKIGEEGIIYTYALAQNYPNPFNPSTTINYSQAEDGVVELEIVDILGRKVAVLVNEFKTKGSHNINFDASHLSSGIYIYKIQAGDFISSRKMILIK